MQIGLHDPLPDDLGDATPGRPKWLVDVWIAVAAASGPRALMLRRAPAHGGFWQGVSGGIEAADASLAAAARRELLEETGIVAEAGDLCDLGLRFAFTSPFSGRAFTKASLGLVLPGTFEVEAVVLSEEHVEVRLVTFDEARALVSWPENREELSVLEARVQSR